MLQGLKELELTLILEGLVSTNPYTLGKELWAWLDKVKLERQPVSFLK